MKKIIVSVVLLCLFASILTGCGAANNTNTTPASSEKTSAAGNDTVKSVELKIPHYKAGQNVGAKFFLPQVERFNKKYDGKYKLTIEEVPQDAYMDKIKQLAQQNKLPALIEGADQAWFEQVMLANNKVYDIKPWIDSHPDINQLFIKDSLDYNTKDGKVVSLPQIVVRPIGLYYNSTMYTPGKRVNQMTLDEFGTSLGDNKIAFMTGENAWASALFLTAVIANEDGGADLLKNGLKTRIVDFNNPILIKAITSLQTYIKNHGSANTVGAVYADAANAFMSKNATIIPNGPWMVGDFAADAKDKWSNGFDGSQVKGDMYPGNVAIANTNGYLWWIPTGLPQEQTDAALAFLEFMNMPEELEAYMLAEGGTAPNLQTSQDFKNKQAQNLILNDLATAITSDTKIVPCFLDVIPPSVANTEFGKLLPKLIDGSFTPEQFCQELSVKAKNAVTQ
jgi:raffinose/stachyose/melibiose transport system substrate-binding protein